MKKFLKYSLIIIVSIITLAILHFEFGLFTRYNYFTAKYDLIKGNTDFVSYGFMSSNELSRPIYSKYGIHTSSLGCVIDWDDSQGGVTYYNGVKDDYFKDKYGSDFFESLEREVKSYEDSLSKFITEDKVIDLIYKLKIVQNEIKMVDSLSKGQRHLRFEIYDKDTIKNIFWVRVMEDNGDFYHTHFHFYIDTKNMIILNPSGSMEEYENN